jgi:hypothetical protein
MPQRFASTAIPSTSYVEPSRRSHQPASRNVHCCPPISRAAKYPKVHRVRVNIMLDKLGLHAQASSRAVRHRGRSHPSLTGLSL